MALIIFTIGLMYFLAKYLSLTFTRTKMLQPDLSAREARIMSLLIPKGLAAAVLASLPATVQMPGYEMIETITYAVVFLSILVSSVAIALVEIKASATSEISAP